jgi:hypothetical protein
MASVRLRCVRCGVEIESEVTPLELVERGSPQAAGREGFAPEPGDQAGFVDLDGQTRLVWFARRNALKCDCGGTRVQS